MTVAYGKAYGKTEGGSGGNRGHSNMNHRERTEDIKIGTRHVRRSMDRKVIEDEIRELQEEHPGLSLEAIRTIIQAEMEDDE